MCKCVCESVVYVLNGCGMHCGLLGLLHAANAFVSRAIIHVSAAACRYVFKFANK